MMEEANKNKKHEANETVDDDDYDFPSQDRNLHMSYDKDIMNATTSKDDDDVDEKEKLIKKKKYNNIFIDADAEEQQLIKKKKK